jgi:SAM-dependent methyltransferase
VQDPTQRFSDRVENYVKYRPTYPKEILDVLKSECHLTTSSVIADVGSGTGILTKLFLDNGNNVLGIEPNREMREAGERLLSGYAGFTSIAATAESTTLLDHSVDFVTAGQSFHWFDREKVRAEFVRILKPGGWIVLVWNDRRVNSTPFLEAYEKLLLTWALDYREVTHRLITDEVIASFFWPAEFKQAVLFHQRMQDFEGWKGGLLSASYAPQEGHPNYAPMLDELHSLFQAHQMNGLVPVEWDTKMYYGQLA